ncbi:MAG TPA: HU family DNA-binding protein [Rhodothermales bacterium]|nr:HU family DNA-binding protein [Rhodothermales bacterium]
MTRTELAQRIAQATGLTRIETEAVLGGFAALVEDALVRGERVEWRGFGVFDVQTRAARTARNPGSGRVVEIPERRVPVFRPARELRAAVAGGAATDDPPQPSRDA